MQKQSANSRKNLVQLVYAKKGMYKTENYV